MNSRNYNIEQALVDPKRVFESPENVLSDPRLDRRAKLEILQRWRDDAVALSAAENEGMEGNAPSLLQRVQQAIEHLTNNGHNNHSK